MQILNKPVHSDILSSPYFSSFISPGGWAFSGSFDGFGGLRNHFNLSGTWIGCCWATFGTALPQPSLRSWPIQLFPCNFVMHFSASLVKKLILWSFMDLFWILSITERYKSTVSLFLSFIFRSRVHYFYWSQWTEFSKLILKIILFEMRMNRCNENIWWIWITLDKLLECSNDF